MKLLANKGILLVLLLTSLPVYGQEVDMTKYQSPLRFKLGVSFEEKPLFADQREIKPLPKVDSHLIDQMLSIRQDLPSWQGMHHLVPGGSAASGY